MTLIAEEERKHWLAGQANENVPEPPTYRIEIVDVFEEYSRFPLREAVKLYGPTIRYNPSLYGRFFHMTNRAQSVAAVKTVAGPLVRKGLLRLISTMQPDVIVSIHPMLNHVTIEAIRELGVPIPFITVVTDLISVHHSWYAPGADSYVVPTEPARQLYLKRGLDPQKVHVLGMPIDPKFTQVEASKEALRKRLELDLNRPVVLLTGGGDGAGGLRAAVHAISQARLPVQLLVIAGRNKRLFVQLQRDRANLKVPLKVFGFVNNMPEMMRASDVIITKAGPGTICEALTCNLPIILSGFVPGQEEGNVTFVVENNVGTLADEASEVVNELRRLIKPGSPIWQKQLENAQRIRRPRASFDIANHILGFLPAPGVQGIWQGTGVLPLTRLRSKNRRSYRVGGALKSPVGFNYAKGLALSASQRLSSNSRRLTFLRRSGPLNLRVTRTRLPRLTGLTRGRNKTRNS